MENQNSKENLQVRVCISSSDSALKVYSGVHRQDITARVLQNLKYLEGAPSVQMHPIPPDWVISRAEPQVRV